MIGGEDQVTFSNSDVVLPSSPPLLPPLPHPFLASTLGTKKGKKQQYDENQQLPLQTQAGGWVFIPSVLFVFALTLLLLLPDLNKMGWGGISRNLCYKRWFKNLQFAQYLGECG